MESNKLHDVFDRTKFANSFLKLVLKVRSPFCFGINARWGDGKTTFVDHFLMPQAKKLPSPLPIVVFDCFEHERAGDPFFSITQRILENVKPTDGIDVIATTEIVKNAAAKVALAGGKIILKAMVKTVLKQELEEVVAVLVPENQASFISDEATTSLETFLARKLQDGVQERSAKSDFQNAVKKYAHELSEYNKIVVVIDELDRCRPSFALEVLESIKHFLSTDGLVFVITYDREQLCELIKHEFGAIDAEKYLHKFINLDLELPTQNINSEAPNFRALVNQYLNPFEVSESRADTFSANLHALHGVYAFQARTIERICVMYCLSEGHFLDPRLILVLIVWSIHHPKLAKKIVDGIALSDEMATELNLHKLNDELNLERVDNKYFRDGCSPMSRLESLFVGNSFHDNRMHDPVISSLKLIMTLAM